MPRTTDARERMLLSGIKLFRECGVEGTAFADVLADSGAPRGSVYHHFPNGREQFVAEVTETAGRFLSALIEQVLEQSKPEDALKQLSAMWGHVLLEGQRPGCPILAVVVEGAGYEQATAVARDVLAEWQSLVAAACVRHGAAPDQASSFATLTIAAFEGAVVLCRAQRDLRPLHQVTEQLCVMARMLIPQ